MFECRGMRHDKDDDAWKRHWPLMRQCCAGTHCPVGPFEVRFVCRVDKVVYVRRL